MPSTRGERNSRRLREVLAAVTPLGWSALVLTVVATVLGAITGWVELAALATVLLVALAIAALQSWGRALYRVNIDLARERVRQGDRVYGRVRARNIARTKLLPVMLELPVGSSLSTFSVPALSSNTEWQEEFRVPTDRRAVLTLGPAATIRADAVGLTQRRRTWGGAREVIVHPQTVSLSVGSAGVMRDLEGSATPSRAEASLEFHALREYVPGDDVRRIHWRSTARTGTVLMRQDEDIRRTRQAIALTTDADCFHDPEEFELAVAVTASWAVDAIRADRNVSLVAGRRLPDKTTVAALDAMTAIHLDSIGTGVEQACGWIAREVPDVSLATLVTGGVPTPELLRRAVSVIGPDALVVAICCEPGVRPEVVRERRHVLLRLGELQDLPALIRRVLQ
ncbi:MAG: DUF58 domain-containing protein [Beutenbergiaceae bacterium]